MNPESINIPVNKPVKEHVVIPFMKGFEIFFSGGEVNDEEGKQIQTVDIWREGDSEEGWRDLTGAGFFRVMNFVEEQMRLRSVKEFVVEATDERRQRIFEKWAERKGCKVRKLPDWDGNMVNIFTVPK